MNIGILGVGAIGGLIASQLSNKDKNVFCLGSSKSNNFINENGIFLKSNYYGEKRFFPVSKPNKNEFFDYLFITVKGYNLDSALDDYKDFYSNKTIAVSLLNGTGYEEIIKKFFKNNYIIGSIGLVEAYTNLNNEIIHKSNHKPLIEISYNEEFLHKHIQKIKDLINASNINCEIIEDQNLLVWRKLIRLCTISTITSISKSNIGFARTNEPFKSIMKNLIHELCQIAAKENIIFDERQIEKTIYSLPEELRTSMQKDIESKKQSEMEFILGETLRKGNSYNLNLPMMTICYSYIKDLIN